MTQANHSPLPWNTGQADNGRQAYIFAHGQAIADCEFVGNGRINEANAALIVRSVNLLPALIQALEEALDSRAIDYVEARHPGWAEATRHVLQKAKQP